MFSSSIGGQSDLADTITMPSTFLFILLFDNSRLHLIDILRKCGGSLSGYSLGNGNQNSTNAQFNAARPGAVS